MKFEGIYTPLVTPFDESFAFLKDELPALFVPKTVFISLNKRSPLALMHC